MKLKTITLLALGLFTLILLNSNSTGPAANSNGDRTGSPLSVGGNSTCGTCHSGGSFGTSFTIVAKDAQNNTVTSYLPDSSYTLEFTIGTTSAPSGFGMQATVLNSGNTTSTGSLTNASANAKVTAVNGTQDVIEHNSTSATNSFSITWTAPSAGNGDVNIYGAGLAVDGTGGTSADNSSTATTLVLTEATPPCIPTAATINPMACGSYTVPSGDSVYTMTGMYMDTILNAGGCDSVLTINLTVGAPTAATISASSCTGSYTVPSGNATYTSSGTVMDTIPNAANCDSVLTINLTVGNSTAATITRTACTSYTVPSGDSTHTASATIMDTIPNAANCDSVITINLTIGEVHANINATSCTGSYTVPSGNATYTSSAVVMDTIPAVGGCDSIMTINLTIDTATYATINPSVCASYTVPSGDSTYTASATIMDTIPNMGGCDSIITINLTVTGAATSTISASSCTGSYAAPSGAVYTMSGTYMDTIPSSGSCDSIITINLTVGVPTAATITETSCTGSYTVPSGNATYTSSGTVMDTIPNLSGCDSVLTINLTVANPAFAYGASQYCSSTASNTTPTITGTSGGAFSSTSGLTLNGGTGEITMSGSTSGTYMVTYSISGCQDSVSVELAETLNISLAYNGSQCTGTTGTAPTVTGYAGTGTFTISPSGLPINASTGALDLAGSTTGSYTVNYTGNDICSSTSSTSVNVTTTNAASFSYDSISYCQETTTNPTPVVSGGTSGSFLCLSGASVNGTTGQINLNSSTADYHPIHYITSGTCPDTSTVIVQIVDCLPPVSVDQVEDAASYRLVPNPNNGNFAVLNDKIEHMADIQVFDVLGQIVHQEQALLAEDAVHHIRPTQQLSEGYYFVRIVDEQSQKTFKIQVLNR
ncbi:MAG: T9SS type A sorting domain-containing protein [Aureispira sp.]|nr:T9SS type A sorting domain-containing protein [Aureispira sp.]